MKILIIQTAFIGDVILATSALEKLHAYFPDAKIDMLVRGGNESLLYEHPFLNKVWVWNKRTHKLRNLFGLAFGIRKAKFDVIINIHRYASSGFITFLSGAKSKIGYDKNPFSFCYSKKVKYEIGTSIHETERIQLLIQDLTDSLCCKPKLYPSLENKQAVQGFQQSPYISISPTSVWFTKQLPADKWIELCNQLTDKKIYLLGAADNFSACEDIKNRTNHKHIENLAGRLGLLESAALIEKAEMNFVNDSAPLHIASAMNAPVTAIFCSTIPAFGFGPLSDNSSIIETKLKLDCRPCGLQGYNACPKGHFKCSEITVPA